MEKGDKAKAIAHWTDPSTTFTHLDGKVEKCPAIRRHGHRGRHPVRQSEGVRHELNLGRPDLYARVGKSRKRLAIGFTSSIDGLRC